MPQASIENRIYIDTLAEMEQNVAEFCQKVAHAREAERNAFGSVDDCNSKRRTQRAKCLTEALITREQACATNEVVARRHLLQAIVYTDMSIKDAKIAAQSGGVARVRVIARLINIHKWAVSVCGARWLDGTCKKTMKKGYHYQRGQCL